MASKMDDWFGARKWRLAVEADGEHSVLVDGPDGDPVTVAVRFSRGRFEIDPPGSFVSPLGSRGKAGVLLQEVSDGGDVPGSTSTWGEAAFRKAKDAYRAIV